MRKFNILAESNIPGVEQIFQPLGSVQIKAQGAIEPIDLRDVDILLVRSSTKVNERLFQYHTPLIVGSTVTGTDHLDKAFLESENVPYVTGEGGNSQSVVDYVFYMLFHWFLQQNASQRKPFEKLHLGVVGHGRIGSRVAQVAHKLGWTISLNDPPKAKHVTDVSYVSLSDMATCDLVTLHVPLEKESEFPTANLIDGNYWNQVQPNQVLLNAARGGVVDEGEWLACYPQSATLILDTFVGEPYVSRKTIQHACWTTPHIAGHSFDGKVGGVLRVYKQIAAFFGFATDMDDHLPIMQELNAMYPLSGENLPQGATPVEAAYWFMHQVYPLIQDSDTMKKWQSLSEEELAIQFKSYRKNYPKRREYHRFRIIQPPKEQASRAMLSALGFQLET